MLKYFIFIFVFLSYFRINLFSESRDPRILLEDQEGVKSKQNQIVVFPFQPKGMTETSAKSFSIKLSQNLTNTNRFLVINPADLEELLEQNSPELLDCFEIGCGVEVGKLVNANYVLVGNISVETDGNFTLKINLVNIISNLVEFEDFIAFRDQNVDERFYSLAVRITEYIPLIGKIQSATNQTATLSLGYRDGLHVGDQLVIYRYLSGNSQYDTEQTELLEHYIGILKLTHVNEDASKGNYFLISESPIPGFYAKTFLSKSRQIALISQVRKELDTYERKRYDLVPYDEGSEVVLLLDLDRKRWVGSVRFLENQRDLYNWVFIGAGSLFAVTQFENNSDLRTFAFLGVTAFGAYRLLQARSKIDDLTDEGKFKGYIDVMPLRRSSEISLNFSFKF